MEPVPQPAGSRARPPGFPPTRIGAGLPGAGAALIDLREPLEASVVSEAFRRLGWRVQKGSLIEAALAGGYDLVLTDDPETLTVFLNDLHLDARAGEPVVCVLSDSDDASVAAAWNAGADWVVWRPFDPEDPMGTRDFIP